MAKNIKELMAELEKAGKILADVHEALGNMEGTNAPKSTKAGKKTPAKDADEEDAEGREAELEAMSYNELKAHVSKLGGKAIGKKPDLIAQILKLEADEDGEDEDEEVEEAPKSKKGAKSGSKASKKAKEEEPEDDEEDEDNADDEVEVTEESMREQLGDFELDELKDIAKEMGVSVKSKATAKAIINALVKDLEKLDETLEAMGYYDEDEENADDSDDEDEDESLADRLAELDQEELATICADNGLSAKGKKQAVIDRIVEAVDNGDIEESDIFDGDAEDADDEDEDGEDGATVEELVEELELADIKKIAKSLDISVTKSSKKPALVKAILAEDEDTVYDVLVELGYADADEDGEDEDEKEEEVEVSAKVKKAEDAVEKKIRAKVESGKLKDSTIKKFLANYYEGDPDCKDCNSDCSKEERVDCYVKIQRKLVNDDGEQVELEEPYTRGGKDFCCGKQLVEGKKGMLVCEVCGEEYSVED